MPPIDREPSERERASKLRRAGVLRGLVALCAAGMLFFFGRWLASSVAVAVGALTLVLATTSPTKAYVALMRSVERIGERIGMLLAWLLLTPVFFLFFVPFGLLTRRGRGDRMGRRFDRAAETYWTTRSEKSEAERRRELERPY
jgi:hypothetical protein